MIGFGIGIGFIRWIGDGGVTPPDDHDLTLTSVPGGVSVEWTGEPVDFTLTPVSGGLSVEWSE